MASKTKAKLKPLTTPTGRLSYPSLDKKRAPPGGGKEKYSATLIFDKEAQKTDAFKALLADVARVTLEEFGATEPDRLRALQVKQPAKKIWSDAIRDGSQKMDRSGEPEAAYAGCVYIVASTEFDDVKKSYYDPSKNKIEAKTLYPGCLARLRVTAHPWEHPTGGSGVSFYLVGAQFVGDGERLGGGGMSADDFDDLPGAQPAGAFPGSEQGADNTDIPF